MKFHLPTLLAFTTLLVFPARAAETRPWKDYRTVMWVGDKVWKKPERLPLFIQRLKEMGINTAMVHGDAEARPWVEAGFPYYVENVINKGLCLKWNSPVTDWNDFVTKWAKNGRPAADLVRPYSLDDPAWLQWGTQRMKDFAARHRANSPLAFNIRDELSTTLSANPFDYDFSDHTLKAFRTWLQDTVSVPRSPEQRMGDEIPPPGTR